MIYAAILLLFFIWSILLFLVDNPFVLGFFFLFHVFCLLFQKVDFKKYVKFLKGNMFFIIFIFLCNLLYSSVYVSILVSFKLFLALCYTFMITNAFAPNDFALGFYYLLYPLKTFKVNVRNISFAITIALAFIPIMMDEAKNIRFALQNKGFDFSLKNVIKRPHIYLITYFNGLFNRVDELEKTLEMKAFQ